MAIPERPALPWVKDDKYDNNVLHMQCDPRFECDESVEKEACRVAEGFLGTAISQRSTSTIQQTIWSVLMDGLRCGEVRYATYENHPKHKPARYKHNCTDCVYLGNGTIVRDSFAGKVAETDLYYCKCGDMIIVRYGPDDTDYMCFSKTEVEGDVNAWIGYLLAEEAELIN